ncbi:acyl-CoA thioesterase [Chromobacterium alkanivorans]|uniref:acyl-CoA thioesterase n=1 Tax=Chromobacterium TaxID=535 RepID=UPI001746B265|nr:MULTISPECIES: thioesterase family protein [Chromobacterium]MBN3006218.1 acyl-CoA thioesterase [Chromobacterium alkanivorans]QOD82987.1 acyl-CoA thioesterase [Chromobacterium haemolyticum]
MQDPHFSKAYPIRFSHCDPAGIVYFPQYLVLSNWLVEDWFTEGLGISFADFIGPRRLGLPIVKLDCEFLRPSRQGEQLTLQLRVARLGGSSLTLDMEGHANGELRLRCRQVLVHISLDSGAAIDAPADVRAALSGLLEEATA